MTPSQRFVKRTFDLIGATIGLTLFSIPGLIIALMVKVSSKGPILFTQIRVGRSGNPITVYKFRTMYVGSDKSGSITTSTDARITALGRFLRRYKLDELPQLLNVLDGSMSFVGPRPDVPGYADRLTGDARIILDLRPGITGPATLYFRTEEELLAAVSDPRLYNDEVIWPKKVELNMDYARNWTLWKDICIVLRTIVGG